MSRQDKIRCDGYTDRKIVKGRKVGPGKPCPRNQTCKPGTSASALSGRELRFPRCARITSPRGGLIETKQAGKLK